MSERTVGEVFTADGMTWQVYAIEPDGTVCSRAVPKTKAPAIDYSRTCSWNKRGRHRKIARCDEYVVMGTDRCRKHAM